MTTDKAAPVGAVPQDSFPAAATKIHMTVLHDMLPSVVNDHAKLCAVQAAIAWGAALASQAARMKELEAEIEHLHSCIEKADRWPPGYEGR